MEHIKRKKTISTILLIASALISGLIIITSYIVAEVQADYNEGISQLETLLTTYNKELSRFSDATDYSFDRFMTPIKLTASALKNADSELTPSAYGSGYIVKRTADGSGRPDGFPYIEYDDDWLFGDGDLAEGSLIVYEDLTGIYARIVDDYYYVEFVDEMDLSAAMDATDPQHLLSDLAYANSCDFLLLGVADDPSQPDDIPVLSATGDFTESLSTKDFGLTAEEIANSAKGTFGFALINDKPYLIQSKAESENPDQYNLTAVMLINAFTVVREAWEQTLSIIFIFLLICIALAVWIISVYRLVISKALTFEQSERYTPASLKRKVGVCVLAGAIIVYFGAIFNQSLESMFLESKHAYSTLTSFFQRLTDDEDRSDAVKKSSSKQVYASAKCIAHLLEDMPELQNAAWLKEASKLAVADYIIIYDKNGDEVITDSRYRGMSLGTDDSSATYDFRRLLKGVRYIHHDKIKDEMTGLTRNLHGISIDLFSDNDSYGAMLMAFDPVNFSDYDSTDISAVAASMVNEGNLIFGADPKTGEILYSSDSPLIGKNTEDLCAGTFPLRNHYQGFIDINGVECYGKSEIYHNVLYYYFVEKSKMTAFSGKYAYTCTFLFLITAIILTSYLLKGYTDEKFRKYASVEEQPDDDEILRRFEDRYLNKQHKASVDMFSLFSKDITPGYKAISVAGFLLFIYIVITILSIYNARYTSSAQSNLITYISRGDWERGFNTFAGAAILFLFCAVAVILFMLRLLSMLMVNLLSERSETICLLIINILSYAVIIAFALISLGYLGVNTRAILASAGLLGLALSLGARDLVADILAGITTIAEGTYQVGEVIEIAGFRGEVAKLGMRSTTLVGRGKNIKTFRNSSIGDIINYSRMNSWYPLTLTFSNSVSISEVENILNEELPKVGAKYPEIISGPEYRGIDSVSSDKTAILILTECRQNDYSDVQLNVNREVLHILKSHNIAATQ